MTGRIPRDPTNWAPDYDFNLWKPCFQCFCFHIDVRFWSEKNTILPIATALELISISRPNAEKLSRKRNFNYDRRITSSAVLYFFGAVSKCLSDSFFEKTRNMVALNGQLDISAHSKINFHCFILIVAQNKYL